MSCSRCVDSVGIRIIIIIIINIIIIIIIIIEFYKTIDEEMDDKHA